MILLLGKILAINSIFDERKYIWNDEVNTRTNGDPHAYLLNPKPNRSLPAKTI